MSRIVDAVTAVLIHDGEILVTHRQDFLKAFPGYRAFPGGKVDGADDSGLVPSPIWDGHDARLVRALIRELREEIALDVEQEPDLLSQLRHLGIALTPPPAPLRFNTHFFALELTRRPHLRPDPQEIAQLEWATPAQWLRRYENGELLAAPPTVAVWRALAEDIQARDIPGLHFETRTAFELPLIESIYGVRQIIVRSNTLPPAQHTNCFLLGDPQSHRVLVDPSPADDAEMERLCALVQRFGIHEIFLTHHHPDHRERANLMARCFEVPIGMSADTRARIVSRSGSDWLDGIAVHEYRENDVLCRWLGRPVRIIEVPGHDEGQLALMPDDRAWCLVGDLIQGLGTVVIAKPEGHMGRYFASLRKLIALAPRAIYPSHGMGMGGTHRLRETLAHRELREQQVLALYREGRSIEQMLPVIYADIDPRLLPLARMNIESHLDKLREDGVIPA
ncbi:Glyoxylase, beta-lactamase superfamily II [Fontimonas thermophila]|uniref:Glyoxylase, beta-lactamase superfamily II n=1 Tax=Fontimonas thermophila TaxID=1076937 RepID=A0A1I2ISC7_9GAMM|nr:MBL fold metallo-hydrolase [Fontimonas thermophila]SFF43421.1 Glyoxylase, beta-lactamase superfamily II [Fontimonas thermophila]